MVAVSEADEVPPACDGNLVGHLCSFCLLRRGLTLRPIEELKYMKRYWEPHGRVRATKFEIARAISACHKFMTRPWPCKKGQGVRLQLASTKRSLQASKLFADRRLAAAMVGAPFARLLANLVVMGTGVLGRAFVEAYKQALQSARRQSAP